MRTPKHPPDFNRPTISIAYLQLMVELMNERGISAQALLRDIPIDIALLEKPDARMSSYQWSLAILRAQSLSREPGLGYEYGLRMRPTVHGVLGYAAMSAASLRQAQEISIRYMQVRQSGFSMQCREENKMAELCVTETSPIPILRTFYYENILLGIARTTAVLLGRELESFDDIEICFDWPEPDYFESWRDRLPTIHFGQRENLVRFPKHYQDIRPVLADPLASQQAIELCEAELSLAATQQADITLRVRNALMLRRENGYPNLDDVAQQLLLSTRTLKRKLQQQGTSFLLLLEEARRRDAQDLLLHSEMPIQAIATRLGYQNPANFSRAFNKWTGEAPAHYRLRMRPMLTSSARHEMIAK